MSLLLRRIYAKVELQNLLQEYRVVERICETCSVKHLELS